MKLYLPIFLALMVSTLSLCAQEKKQLYISNDDHTDYMWTGNESQYRAAFIKMLDYYVDQSDKTSTLASPYQGRFNCDGTFWLWEYEKNKTQSEFLKVIDKIKSGHISVPYNALVSCYGGNNTEGILRGMYYAGYLERKYSLDLDQAVAMENQTLPLGLGSLWAGSGVKYSWKGVCDCASKLKDLKTRANQIYWYKGMDDSAVMMKWYSISPGGNKELGGYAEARNPSLAVEQLTALCQHPNHPYQIAGAFGYGWDDLETTTDSFITTAQEKTNDERQVIVSNQSDFFKAFETKYGAVIPNESLAYGNEWDIYSASMAELSSKVKRSVEKLRAAEAMSSLIVQKDQSFAGNLRVMREKAWMALGLYYEHDWTADGPVTRVERAAWQRKIEAQLTTYVDSLFQLSSEKLGSYIKQHPKRTRFYAFNPLSWKRTDVCDVVYSGPDNVRVVDMNSNKEVSSQVIVKDGKQMIRILATDIPSFGYKVYEIHSGTPSKVRMAMRNNGNILENDFFKVTVTSQGVITSLIDKVNGNRECVSEINGRFMNDLGSGSDNTGKLVLENAGPVSMTLMLSGEIPLKHNSRITLFNSIPRIDIHNEITENFKDVQQWAFSYNLTNPDVWHEEIGAVINAKPHTDGGHYAKQNGRFDWLTINHFADMSSNGYGLTLSNADCSFMKLGNSTITNLDNNTSQLSILAGGQVDGQGLGIQQQGGDSFFTQRFSIGTHRKFDAVSSMRFSLEHQNPLVGGIVTGTESVYPENTFSFLTLNNPDVLVWSLKPAEDGNEKGHIVRLWNMANNNTDVTVSFNQQIGAAYQTTHVETDLRNANVVNGDLKEEVGHHQLMTYRILLSKDK